MIVNWLFSWWFTFHLPTSLQTVVIRTSVTLCEDLIQVYRNSTLNGSRLGFRLVYIVKRKRSSVVCIRRIKKSLSRRRDLKKRKPQLL